MEYILEELLRQRKALAALMDGGLAEKQDGSGEERTVRREREAEFFNDWNWTDGAARGYRGAVRQSSGMAAAETVWDAYAETAGAESRYLSTVPGNDEEMLTDRAAWEASMEYSRAALRRQNEAAGNETAALGGKAAAERAGWPLGRFHAGEQTFARGSRLSGGAEAVEAVSVRIVTQWDGGTAETDARALSRAVQRDARRYDGGFAAH